MKRIYTRSDYPKAPHWAILEFTSLHIEGDERSRTNPGHGFPAHTEHVCNYVAFEDRDEWLREINARVDVDGKFRGGWSVSNWVAFEVGKVAKVEPRVIVDVD